MKIAISGHTGLVGSRIVELLKDDFEFLPISQRQVDITDSQKIHDYINNLDFDLFLHLAAYTNVDEAERQKDLAYRINVEGTNNVFQAVRKKNKQMIYVSTGFVFDGNQPPYTESSQPHPQGVYAQTKLQGEQIVKNQAMIVRIEYPYRSHYDLKKDFVNRLIELLEGGKTIQAVTDNLITPTFIDDIAYGLKHLITHYVPDVFHLVGADSLCSYDAAVLVAKIFSLDQSLIKKTTASQYFQGKAVRPQKARIISGKNNFYPMKTFAQGLKEVKRQIDPSS